MSGSDDDFGYDRPEGGEDYSDLGSPVGGGGARTVHNQPHDEEVAISDDGSEDGQMIDPDEDTFAHPGGEDADLMSSMGAAPTARVDSPPREDSDDGMGGGGDDSYHGVGGVAAAMGATPSQQSAAAAATGAGSSPHVAGQYNPADFAHLDVSSDVNELFQYIGRYKPRDLQPETKIKCFIPDFIPAVGDIDEFIKVPRPDGKPDFLGLRSLDEPATVQSDPTVLNLQLRQVSKQGGIKPMEVSSIDNAGKNPKRIDTWIQSIQDLHAGKPPPTVSYSKNMPEIEALMQEWPQDMEELLNQVRLPSGNLSIDILTLTKVFCNLLDIPVYEGKAVESLHVLFTLYLEFKNNPFLKAQRTGGSNMMGAGMDGQMDGMMTMGSQAADYPYLGTL